MDLGLASLFVALATSSAGANAPGVPAGLSGHAPAAWAPGYSLVFTDEFTGSGAPDPARWDHDVEGNRWAWGNGELQAYVDRSGDNARIADGRLLISARAEPVGAGRFGNAAARQFSSARLRTHGRAHFRYGFFEIRAKLPCGRGTWPAIWLMPVDGSRPWPANGEIDIMEHVGMDPGVVHHSVQTEARNFQAGGHPTAASVMGSAATCGDFHRYQLLWTKDALVIGVDGSPRFSYANKGLGRRHWPFDQQMYLILNVAVGGNWGGQKGIDTGAFPATMEVDYVRVWQTDADRLPPTQLASR